MASRNSPSSSGGYTVRDISELPLSVQREIRGERTGPIKDRPMVRPFMDPARTDPTRTPQE